jgi:hypothetical protein
MSEEQNQAGLKTNAGELPASGEEIIKGARNEDQLDKMREAAMLTPDDRGDLNEIRAADDPDEPDPEEGYQPTNKPGRTKPKLRTMKMPDSLNEKANGCALDILLRVKSSALVKNKRNIQARAHLPLTVAKGFY